MIQQIFKIIWAERKINIWILFELILVFCILWFCVDYIYHFTKRYLEPRGYDVEHVYNINLAMKEDGYELIKSHELISSGNNEVAKDSLSNTLWTIIDRIKKYPDIEYVSLSFAAIPYSDSYSNNQAKLDSVIEYIQYKTVTPEYFNVFGIDILHGKVFDWNDQNKVVISSDKDNLFLKKDATHVKSFLFGSDEDKQVIGVAEPVKRSEFEQINPTIYGLLSKNNSGIANTEGTEICVRVKADVDKDFIERFTKDMQEQIGLDPYFLSSVTPINYLRKDYMKWSGYDNNFKSIFSISTFLFINIFLGIVGTFWFRIQTRRSEVGLRIALGSTRRNIKAIFIFETLIILLLASIIATPICINIALVDMLKDIGVPSIDRSKDSITIVQHLINYGITFFILLSISVAAVWYPSRRASKIQLAEALKDE